MRVFGSSYFMEGKSRCCICSLSRIEGSIICFPRAIPSVGHMLYHKFDFMKVAHQQLHRDLVHLVTWCRYPDHAVQRLNSNTIRGYCNLLYDCTSCANCVVPQRLSLHRSIAGGCVFTGLSAAAIPTEPIVGRQCSWPGSCGNAEPFEYHASA